MPRVLLLPTLGLLMLLSAPAQTTSLDATVAEPEFADVFMRLGDGGKLIPLERQSSVAVVHGVIGIKFSALIPDSKSPVRVHSGQPIQFVVRGSALTAYMDPGQVYGMRRLTSKKDHREFLTYAAGYGGLMGAKAKDMAHLPMEFARYGADSIKVTSGQLPPGEYGIGRIGILGAQAVFCFGVD